MCMSGYEAPCALRTGRTIESRRRRPSVENAEKERPSIAFGCGLRWILGSVDRARLAALRCSVLTCAWRQSTCRSQLRQGCVLATAKLVIPIHRPRRLAQCGELKVVIGQQPKTRGRALGAQLVIESLPKASPSAVSLRTCICQTSLETYSPSLYTPFPNAIEYALSSEHAEIWLPVCGAPLPDQDCDVC